MKIEALVLEETAPNGARRIRNAKPGSYTLINGMRIVINAEGIVTRNEDKLQEIIEETQPLDPGNMFIPGSQEGNDLDFYSLPLRDRLGRFLKKSLRLLLV